MRAVLYAPSGEVEYTLEIEPTAARERLVFQEKRYKLAGVQDGVAFYNASWGDATPIGSDDAR